MAVYKIFPIADATLYSDLGSTNTGLDPILDLSKQVSYYYPSHSAVTRAIVKFSDTDLDEVFTKYIGTSSYTSNFRAYVADAINIPTDLTIELRALAEDFDMGTGKYGDSPVNTTGVSWKYRRANETQPWQSSSYAAGTTGSYTDGNVGGGTWYTGSVCTQSFGVYSDKDLNINVTEIISNYRTGSYVNYGLLLSNTSSIEFDPNYTYQYNLFSRDTNTIYPPCLEFKWDDSVYQPISQNNICSNGNITLALQNNATNYSLESVVKFRVNVRDKYPTRVFSTGSLYTNQKYLPETSYYSVVDYKTGDVLIDFDENYTKISADSKGGHFSLFMQGLQPYRYYKIVIKSVIDDEVVLFDNDYIFKIE